MTADKRILRIYVHIPFCVRKCNYCDFLSFSGCSRKLMTRYIDALTEDVAGKLPDGDIIDPGEYKVDSVFLGGGTPSLMGACHVERIMDRLRGTYDISDNAEITIEANPGTLTGDKLRQYRKCGVNRLSMGVQSFNDRELMNLGRIHNAEDAQRNFYEAREAGFDNINLDLMSAIPGQTLRSYEDTLIKASELKPEHISAYSLILEPGTPFWDIYSVSKESFDPVQHSDGTWPSLPDEDTERAMYDLTGELLKEYGYERYEISNYSLAGYESRHNSGYWTGDEYLGLGLGAVSCLLRKTNEEKIRFKSLSDMESYINAPLVRETEEILDHDAQIEEYMIMGLRMMKGISIRTFTDRFQQNVFDIYGEIIDRHVKSGLLCVNGDRISLSSRGADVCNFVMSDFIIDL